MPPTNDYLLFTPTDTGSNLLTQAEYAADAQRTIGNQPGVARSKLVNKAARQASVIASQLAQLVANVTGGDMLDDGSTAAIIARMTSALAPKAPLIQKFTSGSGTYKRSYIFRIASGNATIGATYTNNGATFTVSKTVASSLEVIMQGDGAPAVSGTLTKSGGTGDSTLTFYIAAAPLYLRVRGAGAGGGASGGSNATNAGPGSAGGNTTFGSSLLTANGGGLGAPAGSTGLGGAGGTATINSPAYGTPLPGCGGGQIVYGAAVAISGAMGGAHPIFGGSNFGGSNGAGATNTGAGGTGGNATGGGTAYGGSGGGSGGGFDVIIPAPSATYAYSIGTGGAGGVAGTGGSAGGAGADGYIEVTEYFQ